MLHILAEFKLFKLQTSFFVCGKIAPAAKRFPQSPFRETGRLALFVPVFRNVFHDLCDG